MKRLFLLPLAAPLMMCDLGPTPLTLGEAARTNARGELAMPLNVTKAFSPTGYFYNVWATTDTTFTVVDPDKWNNFLAHQSIYLHPACADRVPMDTLAKYDTSLHRITTLRGFYSEFNCAQFTYAPSSKDDLYGGVFWLRGNNFGNRPGVRVEAGAKFIRFWARTLSGPMFVRFGAGVNNLSSLKPWPFFTPYVDNFGNPSPIRVPRMAKRKVLSPETGAMVDSVLVAESVDEGNSAISFNEVTPKWTLVSIPLSQIYENFFRKTEVDGQETFAVDTCLPAHELIGAFYWAMEAGSLSDKDRRTDPIMLPDGTARQARYGSSTLLIDGIRYE
jgi:hypothetical protein